MSEIGEPFRRIIVVPVIPKEQPAQTPPAREPVKVPEKEPA